MSARPEIQSPPRRLAVVAGSEARPPLSGRAERAATLRLWRRWTLAAAGLCLAVYLVNAVLGVVSPDNAWGLTYGTLATIFMLAVGAYGMRRRTMQRDLGRSRTWLLVHVYGGGLFLLLVLMHAGLGPPRGALNILLWGLSIWVSASGALGVLLQKWIPRSMASGLSMEVVFERIPELIGEMREEAATIAETAGEPVQRLYERSLAPVLRGVAPHPIYYFDITGGIAARMREWDYVREILTDADRSKLDRLKTLYRSKLELDAQYTLQRTLRWWLYSHVPVSVVLVGAVVIHLFAVLYY